MQIFFLSMKLFVFNQKVSDVWIFFAYWGIVLNVFKCAGDLHINFSEVVLYQVNIQVLLLSNIGQKIIGLARGAVLLGARLSLGWSGQSFGWAGGDCYFLAFTGAFVLSGIVFEARTALNTVTGPDWLEIDVIIFLGLKKGVAWA